MRTRVAKVLLVLIAITAVLADVLASDLPIITRQEGHYIFLPVYASHENIDKSEPVLRPPIRYGPTTLVDTGEPHFLGVDIFGRDLLSMLIHGARRTTFVWLIALCVALLLGVPAGLFQGQVGRAGNLIFQGILYASLVVPMTSVVMLANSALRSTHYVWVAVIVGILRYSEVARVVSNRVQFLSGQPYIFAARALGLSRARILLRHVVPNIWAPLPSVLAMLAVSALFVDAGLAALGIAGDLVPNWGGTFILAIRHFVESNETLPAACVGALLCSTVWALYTLASTFEKAPQFRSR